MNIVNSGTSYRIFDESVQTYKELPVGCYQIDFNPMSGYSLISKKSLSVVDDKIYGNTEKDVAKVLKSFKLSNRNFGIILSGEKGVGKSLFARVLANKANEQNLPLILATANYPGLADFIGSIEQECIVLFDEFEKNFPCDYDDDDDYNSQVGADGGVQNNLLGLFDGIDGGKKLFVITCNDTYKLSKFFLNRPGRFHYHFEIVPPTAEEIKEYLIDNLKVQDEKLFTRIIQLSLFGTITYDCLRAICFELNQGYDLDEAISCLNLTRNRKIELDFTVTLDNGIVLSTTEDIDLFRSRYVTMYLHGTGANYRDNIEIAFVPADIKYNENGFDLDINTISIRDGSQSLISAADYKARGKSQQEDYLPVDQVRRITAISITKSAYSSFVYRYMV